MKIKNIFKVFFILINPLLLKKFIFLIKKYPNAVIHVINGILKPSDIEALGNNDLKMLKEVGTGVAMENAIPSVKEAADYVTLSNDEEGVAKFIEKYVLE